MTLKIEDSELGLVELDYSWWFTSHAMPNSGWHIRFSGTGRTKFGVVAESGRGFLSYKSLLYRYGRDRMALENMSAEQVILLAEKHLANMAKVEIAGEFGDGN
jgi:hypothetical protein